MGNDAYLDWIVRTTPQERLSNRATTDFGDEGPWVQLLGFAWSNIDVNGVSIRPRKSQVGNHEPHQHAIAQWSMAVHLLGLGLGWNDIGLGLRRWRENRYELGVHPILDFLWANFLHEIEALEIWFGFYPRTAIANALEQIKIGRYVPDTEVEIAMHLAPEYARRREMWLYKNEKERGSVSRLLLQDNDSLHLDDHCGNSFLETGWDLMGSQVWNRFEGHAVLMSPYYQGWAHRLAMHNDRYKELTEAGEQVAIDVYLEGIGSLGKYVWDEVTQRWWRNSRDALSSRREHTAHLWGHDLES